MSAQTSYGFSTRLDVAGGIYDLAPYAVDTFLNEENTGVMKFGVAAFSGTNVGSGIKLPVSASTNATFEGITTNNRTTEYDMDGVVRIVKGAPIGVMRSGRIYARLADGATPEYGDAVYVVKTGDDAGCVTDSSSSTIAIKARFLGRVDTANGIALIELFNEAQ